MGLINSGGRCIFAVHHFGHMTPLMHTHYIIPNKHYKPQRIANINNINQQ